MSLSLPKCDFCKYYHEEDNEKMSCDAFPNGIPGNVMIADELKKCKDKFRFERKTKHPS